MIQGALSSNDRLQIGLSGAGVLLAAASSSFVGGLPGVLVGIILLVSWLFIPPIVLVALGQLLFVTLLLPTVTTVTFVLVEASLILLFLSDTLNRRRPFTTLTVGISCLAAACGLVLGSLSLELDLWQNAAILIGVTAFISYALHRYTVVTLEVANEF